MPIRAKSLKLHGKNASSFSEKKFFMDPLRKNLFYKSLLLLIVPVVLYSCKKEEQSNPQPPEVPHVPAVLLKDMILSHLPSPYYHFEYDTAGKPIFASFASELYRYDIAYNGARISEMRNNILVNKDRMKYFYDYSGNVTEIRFADSAGLVYEKAFFTYDGQKLINVEWDLKSGTGFIILKTLTMSYYPDGNLQEIRYHSPATGVNEEITYVDRFEQYDNKINVDGFGLIHTHFFEHLILLPQVQLQKNNPRKIIHTGDGTNYQVDYNYTYNGLDLPLVKNGEFLYLNGADAGKKVQIQTVYSYYE